MTDEITKNQKKRGRKNIKIDEAQLRAFLRLKPTLEDCAAFFNCSKDTIERACKRYGKKKFADFRYENMVHTRFDLIRLAISKSHRSDSMHIFSLKNLCGWSDKQETQQTSEIKIIIDNTDSAL